MGWMNSDPTALSPPRDRSDAGVTEAEVHLELAPPAWAFALTNRACTEDQVRTNHGTLVVRECVGRDATLVSASLVDVGSPDRTAFHGGAIALIVTATERLRRSAHPSPVRVWNFLPGIYAAVEPGVNRYMDFNAARHAAFVSLFGVEAVRSGDLPTASCLGHNGDRMAVHVLGTLDGGRAVENPRQTPAFRYSAKYGPRPPCFARATACQFGGDRCLLVGGTASVLGEDSVHGGSREAQLAETLANLRALVARAQARDAADTPASEVLASRVYYKREVDRGWVQDALPSEFTRHSAPQFVRADICREELLLEIELLVRLEHVA